MPQTKRSDLVYVDILQEAIQQALAGKLALFGTGAAVMSSTLPTFSADGNKLKGGDTVRVPYFAAIGELDDVAEGNALVPQKISSSSETASVIHSGKAGEFTNWSSLVAQGKDPYAVYAEQFAEAWMRRLDMGLITKAGATALVHDVSAVGAGLIGWDAFNDAIGLWGDSVDFGEIALVVVHSKIMQDLWKLKDSSGRPLLVEPQNDGQLPKFRGVPVKVSNRVPVAAGVYSSLLCAKNALVGWYNGEPSIDADKDILADSQVVAIHTYHVEHLYSSMPGKPSGVPGVVALKTKAST